MEKRVALNGRIALERSDELLFINFKGYEDDKMQFTVEGDNTQFSDETDEIDEGDHVAISVLASVFETVKDAEKIITPNSLKYDIDRWFTDIDVLRETNYFTRPTTNDTDYNFPDMWGILPERVNDENDPLTKEEADQMMSDWLTTQRVLWHLKLQKDAGMWGQWSDERLEKGMGLREAWQSAGSNQYRDK